MKFKYTFTVKDFKSNVHELNKIFDKELTLYGIRDELGVIFDQDNVKNVRLKSVEKLK